MSEDTNAAKLNASVTVDTSLTTTDLGSVTYCKTIDEALKEVQRRKSASAAEGLVTRFEESPYGGYRVYSIDAELFIENRTNPAALSHGTDRRVYR